MSEGWLVVRSAPKFVGVLQVMAWWAGARTWKPVYAARTRVGKNRKPAIRYPPMFPGYLFVRADDLDAFKRIPTQRYQVLRRDGDRFFELGSDVMTGIAEEEARMCQIGKPPKAAEQFSVGDLVQPAGNLFGEPMRVASIYGSTLELDLNGKRLSVDANAAKRVL